MLNRCSNFVVAAGLTVAIMAVAAGPANAKENIGTSVMGRTVKPKTAGVTGIVLPPTNPLIITGIVLPPKKPPIITGIVLPPKPPVIGIVYPPKPPVIGIVLPP